MKTKSVGKNIALKLCVTAMFAAVLVAGKEALAFLPNIEVVTIFIALCAYVWGLSVAIPAVLVFIAVDMAIWGIITWVISYLIHWNFVALCFRFLALLKMKNRVLTSVVVSLSAIIITLLFGVLTSAVDTLVGFTGKGFFLDTEMIFARFVTMYVSGIPFYATQIVCNAFLFAVAFVPLVQLNNKMHRRFFPDDTSKHIVAEQVQHSQTDFLQEVLACDQDEPQRQIACPDFAREQDDVSEESVQQTAPDNAQEAEVHSLHN